MVVVTTAQHRPDNTVLAVTLIVVAVFMMSVQDMIFKQYSTAMSMWQIFALRGLFALPLYLSSRLLPGDSATFSLVRFKNGRLFDLHSS